MAAMPPSFRIAIKHEFPPLWGHLIGPESNIHQLLSEIARRAISIGRTNRAQCAMRQLAIRWAHAHKKVMNDRYAVQTFQQTLKQVEQDPSKWPTMVMDWTMEEDEDAITWRNPKDTNVRSSETFPLGYDLIAINGVVRSPAILLSL
jgi:hypothetical protein